MTDMMIRGGWRIAESDDDETSLVRPNGARKRKTAPVFERPADAPLRARAAAGPETSPFTYRASRVEQGWMLDALAGFYADNVITDVVRKVKGGKEATVYCCRAHRSTGAEWLAAKIYRPRQFRQLRNDKLYREGREILDEDGKLMKEDRAQHAIHSGKAFGKDLLHVSWLQHEANALRRLHAAGVSVPKLFASGPNVLLMEYIGEPGSPAPPLSAVGLDEGEARLLFDRLLADVWRMLAHDVVHGDLSAYNVLHWGGDVRIIDFPQVVDPNANPHAYAIFERDVERLCSYFAGYGIESRPRALARDMWRRHIGPRAMEDIVLSTPLR